VSLSEIEGRLHSCASPNLSNLTTELPKVLLESFINLQHAAVNYKTGYYELENSEIVVACFKMLITK
jgi:hypothetical protein